MYDTRRIRILGSSTRTPQRYPIVLLNNQDYKMLPSLTTDPKRTGVKAYRCEDIMIHDEATPLGACLYVPSDGRLWFGCPGCQRNGAIRCDYQKPADSPSWFVSSGDLEKPETLTLSPSINCVGCCGWHGYLTNGVFVSC